MARKVELRWNCGECDTKGILGRHKRCTSCGSPREKGEMRMDGLGRDAYDPRTGRNKAPTVTDPELLRLAAAGADWFCARCGSGNRGDGDRCISCAGPREDLRRAAGPPSGPTYAQAAALVAATHVLTAAKGPPAPPRPPPAYPADGSPDVPAGVVAGGAGVALLPAAVIFCALVCSGVALYWSAQTYEVTGKVVSTSWTRDVRTEKWADTTKRLWRHQTTERPEVPPRSGAGEKAGLDLVAGSCRDEFYENERYKCGSHEECRDVYRTERESYSCSKSERYVCGETCNDDGNGFATCHDRYCTRSVPDTCHRDKKVFDHEECKDVPDYCTRPIYKAKCDYRTQEWVDVGSFPSSGVGRTFSWGKAPEGDEYRSRHTGTYTVRIAYTDGVESNHDLTWTSSGTAPVVEAAAADYLTWSVGDPAALEIYNLGTVREVRHVSLESP